MRSPPAITARTGQNRRRGDIAFDYRGRAARQQTHEMTIDDRARGGKFLYGAGVGDKSPLRMMAVPRTHPMSTFETIVSILYLASLILQVMAVLFAVRMSRRSALRAPWYMMAAAMTAMAVFRLVAMLTSGVLPG